MAYIHDADAVAAAPFDLEAAAAAIKGTSRLSECAMFWRFSTTAADRAASTAADAAAAQQRNKGGLLGMVAAGQNQDAKSLHARFEKKLLI